MLIKCLPSTEKFLQLVDRSKGAVLLHLPDGSVCNLKGNHMAQQLLKLFELGQEGMRITVSNPKDVPAFLRYMMDAAPEEKIAC